MFQETGATAPLYDASLLNICFDLRGIGLDISSCSLRVESLRRILFNLQTFDVGRALLFAYFIRDLKGYPDLDSVVNVSSEALQLAFGTWMALYGASV